ncbi:hypothetical protein PQO03_00645 [Lentisphaera profundi]|uniref:Glycosyl hydrolase-like 10 domain-containing protein n=1 Tax=Lentisphaera profundi TaxID=1658616 RepID=A0ABY7VRX6_9BACT|nr:hypothetical protein [Lentisphaera profundi]WDE96472.1 hypothetical protein PQO03_00645 [Lentisphaera profundi]
MKDPKRYMNNLSLIIVSLILSLVNTQLQADETSKPVTYANGKLENGIISIVFNLKEGDFSILDSQSKEILLSEAKFGLPSGRRPTSVKFLKVEDVKDVLGLGKKVILMVSDSNLLRYSDDTYGHLPAQHLFSYTLYRNNPALVFGFGLKTPDYLSMRLMKSDLLKGAQLFGGKTIKNLKTLNGSAGAQSTLVSSKNSRICVNNLMLTGLVGGTRKTAVWGGLRYNEFAAVNTLDHSSIGFYAEDPVGRLIEEGQTYFAKDTFYLDVHTSEPFEALERYGLAMRAANKARPNIYDFPITCGWSVSHVSKLPNINNSAKLIEELELANKSGLTRYTDVSLRLEPDKYNLNTEQGWWDDAHMQTFKHLVPPYETIAKWSKAMRARKGIPYIYMQLGMPSDDFSRKFPQYLLFNDASKVDKRTPGKGWTGRVKHPHHQPYATYDYTDKEFSKHFVKAWKKLSDDGIRGVKVDYAATGWRPEGGFDDRYSTCNAAYRRAFKLLREAFGKDGFIDERNLGVSGRPCLDVTAGLVDTQRTWADSNKFVPQMVSKSGLRWYKNRTVFNYYSDTKTVHGHSQDILESMLTMNFLSSGRLDLSSSYSLFTPKITHTVSRTYPHYKEPKTARPLDAFTGGKDPQVYDLELTPDWHQLVLYNTEKRASVVSTSLSGERVDNALGLDPKGTYHAYDFWSDKYLGKLPGTARIEQKLKANCSAMISIRKATPCPQVISTDRHILQGWVDLADLNWDPASKTLSGTAKVIGGEPFKIVIANNGHKLLKAATTGGKSDIKAHSAAGLNCLILSSANTTELKWKLKYK